MKIETCRTALEKKILAGPEQKLPLERRNFGNYFLENEATWYIEHFTSLLDKNIRNIKIENLRKFQKSEVNRNEMDFSGIISGKSVRATEFCAPVLEETNESST